MSLRQVRKPHMKKIDVTTTIAMRLVRIGAGPVAGFDVAYSMARSVCVARRWPRGRAIKTASAPVVQRCHPAEGCARASDAASSRPGLHPRRAFHPASRHLHKRRSAERSEEHTSELQSLMRNSY